MMSELTLTIVVVGLPFATSAVIAAACHRAFTIIVMTLIVVVAIIWVTSVRYAAFSLSLIVTFVTLLGYVLGRLYRGAVRRRR